MPSSNSELPPSRRRRGAQPGNTNAYRHGFYSRFFQQQEIDDLDAFDLSSFASEVALLRTSTRRLFELNQGIADLDKSMTIVNTIGMAAYRIANMIYKANLMAGDQDNPIAQALSEALSDVIKDWNLH